MFALLFAALSALVVGVSGPDEDGSAAVVFRSRPCIVAEQGVYFSAKCQVSFTLDAETQTWRYTIRISGKGK